MWSIRVALVAILVALAMPAAADGPIKLGPKTWAAYEEYLRLIGPTGRGAFAIAPDGLGGGGSYCEAETCTPRYKQTAIANCEKANPGYTCLIFAIDRDPQIPFEAPE